MNYKVFDSEKGKVFGTLKEAVAYADEIAEKFNVFVEIRETSAAVTHVYMMTAGE